MRTVCTWWKALTRKKTSASMSDKENIPERVILFMVDRDRDQDRPRNGCRRRIGRKRGFWRDWWRRGPRNLLGLE